MSDVISSLFQYRRLICEEVFPCTADKSDWHGPISLVPTYGVFQLQPVIK